MKASLKSFVACVVMAGVFNLTAASGRASEPVSFATAPARVATAAPRVVAEKKPLSALELAQYRQKAVAAETAAHRQAAGAADNTTVWIVVGVVVVVGVVALAAGGGHGMGGSGY